MVVKRIRNLRNGKAGLVAVFGLVAIAVAVVMAWPYFAGSSNQLLSRIPEIDEARLSERAKKMMASCEESIRVNPEDATAWGLLGRACLAHQLQEPARQCFEVASELEPENYEWFYSQALSLDVADNAKAIPLIEKAIELCKRGKDQLKCRLAEIYFDESDMQSCRKLVESVLEGNARQLRANMLMARLYLIENKTDESLKCIQVVLDGQPNRKEALRLMSQIQSRKGNASEANRYATKAEDPTAFDEAWPDPVYQKVLDLRKDVNKLVANALQLPTSMIKERVRVLKEAVAEEPHEPNWHGFLGQTYLQMRQFEHAKDALENGIRLHPDSPVLRYTLGLVYLNQQNFKKAIPVLEKAVALKQDYDQAYLNLGIAYRENGQVKKSIDAIKKSIAILPGGLKSQLNLAASLERDKQFDAAVDAYKECLKLDDQSAEVHFLFGRLLSERREYANDAKKLLSKAIEIDPTFAEAQDLLNSID